MNGHLVGMFAHGDLRDGVQIGGIQGPYVTGRPVGNVNQAAVPGQHNIVWACAGRRGSEFLLTVLVDRENQPRIDVQRIENMAAGIKSQSRSKMG